MPRSVVAYTSPETFLGLKESARKRFEADRVKPYTLSFAQKTQTGNIRMRMTELSEDACTPLMEDLAWAGTTLASSGDPEAKSETYEELLDGADRFRRVAALQFASPVMIDLAGRVVPFPVHPTILERYVEVWNAFSEVKMRAAAEWLPYVHVTDFRISCLASPYGAGTQGWVALEMERGRSEAEIGLFNALVDFAFYCGTGLHTEEGLGQTRRFVPTLEAGRPRGR